MPRRFQKGESVHVAGLGTGVIREVRNGGRVVVEIKGRALLVDETQLAGVVPHRKRAAALAPPAVDLTGTLVRPGTPALVDLHGLTTVEAVNALDAFISDAILAGLAEVRVVHGRSGGRLKAAVHRRLGSLPVRGFRVDPANQGVTIVAL